MGESTRINASKEVSGTALIDIYINQCASDVHAESRSEYREYCDHNEYNDCYDDADFN